MNADRAAATRRARFEDLYGQYSREVWALAYGRWLDSNSAQDITQETFLRLWRHLEEGSEALQNPRAWLLRVARNLADDYSKSAFRRNGTQSTDLMNGLGSGGIPPIDQMERDELSQQVRAVLAEMAPADREILTLRYAFDYDAHAIAEMQGINVAAIHMRLSRARQRLADRLQALGVTTRS